MRKLSCAAAALVVVAAVSTARADPCAKSASGAPMATGTGNRTEAPATNPGLSRVRAERAAFLTALQNLKSCLGADAAKVTGWTLTDVRYFDSDPIVEVDVAASFDANPQVSVLGSALPNVERASATGNVKRARLDTIRAAKTMAERNAREALAAVFPESSGTPGDVRQQLSGSLGGCTTDDVAYWDDHAVSVKLTCGRAVKSAEATPHPAPKLEKH